MTSPQPADPPVDDDGACLAWAQPSELGPEVRALLDDDEWCSILSVVSDVLWGVTGRRWRNTSLTETVTLDPDSWCPPARSWPWGSADRFLWNSQRPERVRLPRPDVTEVTDVTLEGVEFLLWRLSGAWLIRTDRGGWPMCNTTLITYRFGRPVPHGGVLSALTFASELGKSTAGKPCSLPARVQSVTRQGISFTTLDDMEFLTDGLTGLYSVDLWIRSVNPHGLTQEPQVWSPDIVTARRY